MQGGFGPHEMPVVATGRQRPARARWLVAGIAGIAAAGVLGAVGWMFFGGGSGRGAASPEAAVERLVEAINSGDSLAIVNAFAPSETDGVVAAAERLLVAVEVEPHRPHYAATVALGDVEVVERGRDAALVAFTATVTNDVQWPIDDGSGIDPNRFDTDEIVEALDDTYVAGQHVDIDELTVAVVREDGGWFVSPLLTFGDYVVKVAGAAAADWDAASDLPPTGSGSPAEALERLVDAGVGLELVDIASNADLAVARAAMVFEDAVDERFDDLRDAFSADIDLRLTEVAGGVQVDRVDVVASDGYDHERARFADWCLETDSGEECLRADWLRLPEALLVSTSNERGGHVVDTAATLSWAGERLADTINRATLLHLLGLEQIDEATPIELGRTLQVTFGGDPYVVLDLPVATGQQVVTTFDGVEVHERFFRESGSDRWRAMWGSTFAGAGTIRYVLTPDDGCSIGCLDWDLDATGQFAARLATVQDWNFPNGLAGELDGHGAFVFRFAADSTHEFTVTLPDGFSAEVEPEQDGGSETTLWPDRAEPAGGLYQLVAEPGWNWLWVVNHTDAPATFEFTPQISGAS